MNSKNNKKEEKDNRSLSLNMAQLQINNSKNSSIDQSKVSVSVKKDNQPKTSNDSKSVVSNNSEFMKLIEKVEVAGKVPTARFGHSIVIISPTKSVLFGGAVGDTRNYAITNDTYCFSVFTRIWSKLECNSN